MTKSNFPLCDRALAAATDTRALELGAGVLGAAGTMFAKLFAGKRPLIVADKASFAVAGRQLQQMLTDAGLNPAEPYVFDQSDLHAEWQFVQMLDDALAPEELIAVAVGSGTINDLCKLSSEHNRKRYMTVATAASMDGYTAYGASITYRGAKQTFSCPAPLGVVADTDIIATAPADMTASGYADLFAKVPAGADWILADALGVEPIDKTAFSLVQDGLKAALADTDKLRSGDTDSIARLTEGLLLSGFAMQAHRSSRPASGADHQFSHLWNMEHHVTDNGHAPSHGFQVSIGMLASTALYDRMLQEDFTSLDVESCVAQWPELDDALSVASRMFAGTDFPDTGVVETRAKYVTREQLRRQLDTLRSSWPQIRAAVSAQIIPFDQAAGRLAAVGAPVRPEQIGISMQRLRDSVIRAQHIRRRFTILDLAVRTCKLGSWLDDIFGPKGPWAAL